MSNFSSLANLGWQSFYQRQLSLEEWEECIPARIIEQHKSEIILASQTGVFSLSLLHGMPDFAVGDWLLLDNNKRFLRLLERKTCFLRKAAGSKVKQQLIASNVDTAFIVCSMNEDFNLNRIERFLALVNESGADPVLVLSKSDLSDSPEQFVVQVQALDAYLFVESVDCRDMSSVSQLGPWIKSGCTVAVLGSSGVGKSTLINTLLGEDKQSTSGIREDDDKGRHTTTRRSLILLESGGLIMDTPGMRELQLAHCREGISTTFADLESLSSQCRYKDCLHRSEPGCAVRKAIETGGLDERRLDNYRKLLREEALNSKSLAQRRADDKALGKYYKHTQNQSRKLKGR